MAFGIGAAKAAHESYTDGMTDTKPKLRWFQFSLRTLLIFVTLFAILLNWIGPKIRQAKRQREAVVAIQNLGGVVTHATERNLVGMVFRR